MSKEQSSSQQIRAAVARPSLNKDFWPVDDLASWRDAPMETLRGWLAQQRVSGVRTLRAASTETYSAMFSAWLKHLSERQVGVLEAGPHEALTFFTDKTMEPVSRRRYLQLLERIYAHLLRCGRPGANPMQDELSKERELERELPPFLSVEQQGLLVAHLKTLPGWKGARDRALASLLLGAGLRTNEVSLQLDSDIREDFAVHVQPQSVHRPHDSLIVPDGPYREWLTAWRVERQQRQIPGGLVVPSTLKGKAFDPSGLFRRTKAWLEDAKVTAPQSGPNILRSTFARNALESGRYTVEQVQEFLGHEDSRTTEKHLPLEQAASSSFSYNA